MKMKQTTMNDGLDFMRVPTVNVRPVPCDLAREHCEQIYNDWREASHIDTVSLMMMAYRQGARLAREAAYDEMRAAISPSRPEKEHEPLDLTANRRTRVVSEANGYEGGCEP